MWKLAVLFCVLRVGSGMPNDDYYRIRRNNENVGYGSAGAGAGSGAGAGNFFFPFDNFGQNGNTLSPEEIFSEFFKNFESSLKDAFENDLANQRAAIEAAQKAFKMTNNNPQVAGRFGDDSMVQSAYAGGYLGPAGSRQIAAINPPNPNMPNVNVMMTNRAGGGQNPSNNFYSVSSSSFSSSAMDPSGRTMNTKGAKTIVNDNGQIKEYSVHS